MPPQDRHVVIDRSKTTLGQTNGVINSTTLERQQSFSSLGTNSYKSSMQQSVAFNESISDGLLLQSRRLTGDITRKGEEWWKICQANDNDGDSSAKRSLANISAETNKSQCQENRKAQRIQKPQHKARSNNQKKVYIVPNKKRQYGHLISNHGGLVRDENKSPIVYKRPEPGRKEVAPLWFHPFNAG